MLEALAADDQDPATGAYLRGTRARHGASHALSHSLQRRRHHIALRDIESLIEHELGRLQKMEKHSEAIRKNVDVTSDEIRNAHKALEALNPPAAQGAEHASCEHVLYHRPQLRKRLPAL